MGKTPGLIVVAAFLGLTRACLGQSGEGFSGMLTDHGVPAANVKLAAVDSDNKQSSPTYTDRNGLYFIRGIDLRHSNALRVWVKRDQAPVEFPIVSSVKPSSQLPPLEIRDAAESKREQALTRDEIGEFLRKYYAVYQAGDAKKLASMYGEFVDFYETGSVDRAFVEKDKSNFIQYFKTREFKLKDFEVFDTLVASEKRVRFTFSFRVKPTTPPMKEPHESKEVWTLRRIRGNIQIVRCQSDRMG
jgi:hypothetical protein